MNKEKLEKLEKIAKKEGTPLLVMDHAQIRENYRRFKEKLPRVQAYYAVKANSSKEIVETLLKEGSSFDVASICELETVLGFLKNLSLKEHEDFIWDKIIYANPVKKIDSLKTLNPYKPLLTYDCIEEMEKIREYCPQAGVLLRIKVPNENSQVRFDHKFGLDYELAPDLIKKTIEAGLGVEGISFHAGSQCNNPNNFVKALEYAAYVFSETDKMGLGVGVNSKTGQLTKLLDIGGGFPVKYNGEDQTFGGLAKIINKSLDALFPVDKVNILAEPGRYFVANAGTTITKVILAKNSKNPPCYHLDDGVYGLHSAMIFDHLNINMGAFKEGELLKCQVFGPTCDGLDTLSKSDGIPNSSEISLPRLDLNDLVYTENMGAYTIASSTNFNGYELPKVVHINIK